eukprot:10418505-Ditylum_brightwellii.AAC.2
MEDTLLQGAMTLLYIFGVLELTQMEVQEHNLMTMTTTPSLDPHLTNRPCFCLVIEDLILMFPVLSYCALPWLIKALNNINVVSKGTTGYFSVLRKLVEGHAHANYNLSNKGQ